MRHIGNADQAPLTFGIVTKSTIGEKGLKSVPILTTGHDKDRFAVMLACLGDGMKREVYLVFERKMMQRSWFSSVGLWPGAKKRNG